MTAAALAHRVWARVRPATERRESRALRDARARLQAYVSPLEQLSAAEREALCSYPGPEVSGSLPKRQSR